MEREQEEWEYREEAVEGGDRSGLVNRLRASGWQLVGESGQTLIFRRPRPVTRTSVGRPSTNTILIAIADSSRRFHLSATLAIEGYQVLEASDAARAWKVLEQSTPGIAILDRQLPGRPLVDLVRAIKRDPSLRHTRVIILGSSPAGADLEDALAREADACLGEPLTLSDLLAQIDRISGGGS